MGAFALRALGMGLWAIVAAPLWPITCLATLCSQPYVAPRLPKLVLNQIVPRRLRGFLRPFAWPIVAVMAAGQTLKLVSPDVARSLRVWRRMLPIFSVYMYTKYTTDLGRRLFRWSQDKVDRRWAARHEWGGKQVYGMISSVQGYYVKSGQVLATKRELIPEAWCSRLAKLWDDTKPRPWQNVKKSVELDLSRTVLAAAVTAQSKQAKRSEQRQVLKKSGLLKHDPVEGPLPHLTTTAPGLATGNSPKTPTKGAIAGAPAGPPTPSQLKGSVLKGLPQDSPARAPPTASMVSAAPSWAASAMGSIASWLPGWTPTKGAPSHTGGSVMGSPGQDGAVAIDFEEAAEEDGDTPPPAPLAPALFTVSPTAMSVLLERAGSRPAPPRKKRGWFGRRGGAKGKGGEIEYERDEAQEARAKEKRRQGLGAWTSKWFDSIDPVPLASASIAQVHAATLSPELLELLGASWPYGSDVVVKVQHGDVVKLMGADLRNMGRIARFLNRVLPFDVLPAVNEMRSVIPKEFDFEREARLMGALRERLARVAPKVVIPAPLTALCGPGLVVMQRMRGTPLTTILEGVHLGSESAREGARKCLLPVLEAYGHMILVDGLFHADPHPGNMLLLPDGKVALLDFGQCKALSSDERRALCGLYLALSRNDIRSAVTAVKAFGLEFGSSNSKGASKGSPKSGDKAGAGAGAEAGQAGATANGSGKSSSHSLLDQLVQKGLDPVAIHKMLTIMFDTRFVPEASYGFGGGAVVEGAEIASFPGPLYLICRAILILRGIVAALGMGHDISVVSLWARQAAQGLKEPEARSRVRAEQNAALDRGLQVKGVAPA